MRAQSITPRPSTACGPRAFAQTSPRDAPALSVAREYLRTHTGRFLIHLESAGTLANGDKVPVNSLGS